MSSLGLSHYSSLGMRKLPEGNGLSSLPTCLSPLPTYSSSPVTTILSPVTTHATYSTTTAPSSSGYPYFSSSPSIDLSSPLYGSYSTTGVFSSKTLQPSRPRSKARANTGKVDQWIKISTKFAQLQKIGTSNENTRHKLQHN